MTRSALVPLLVCLSGCWSRERYLIEPAVLVRAARREKGGRQVYVRASALPEAPLQLAPQAPSGLPVRIEVAARNQALTAGATLTWVGSVLSVAGSIVFFTLLARGEQDSPLFVASGVTALVAEPIMWAGTILWPLALVRPPYEVRRGQVGVRYLNP
jgi:hypothetical protein